MIARKLAIAAVAIVGTLVAAGTQARGRDDVQFSVTIGTPFVAPVPIFAPVPVVRYDGRFDGHHDRGFDGRYDGRAAYHAPRRWDVDGDGIPNRYDRHDNRRGGWSRW